MRAPFVEVLDAVRSSAKSQLPWLDHLVMPAPLKMLAANLFWRCRSRPPHPPLAEASANARNKLPAASLFFRRGRTSARSTTAPSRAAMAAADAKSLHAHVDHRFLTTLLPLFASEDPLERDRFKAAYHALYSKLAPESAFMRRSMANALLRFANKASSLSSSSSTVVVVGADGVGEALEICGSIINGFAVPLKEEHRGFLIRVLLPLRRTRWRHSYHRQLV